MIARLCTRSGRLPTIRSLRNPNPAASPLAAELRSIARALSTTTHNSTTRPTTSSGGGNTPRIPMSVIQVQDSRRGKSKSNVDSIFGSGICFGCGGFLTRGLGVDELQVASGIVSRTARKRLKNQTQSLCRRALCKRCKQLKEATKTSLKEGGVASAATADGAAKAAETEAMNREIVRRMAEKVKASTSHSGTMAADVFYQQVGKIKDNKHTVVVMVTDATDFEGSGTSMSCTSE